MHLLSKCLALYILLLPLCIWSTAAPEILYVHVRYMNIGNIDPKSGVYDADIVIMFSTSTGRTYLLPDGSDNETNLRRMITNAISYPWLYPLPTVANVTGFRFRCQLTYYNPNRLFPFMRERLLLAVEDNTLNNSQLVLKPRNILVDTEISGWLVGAPETQVVTAQYGPQNFSRLEILVPISWPILPAMLQFVMPPVSITIVQLFTLPMRGVDQIGSRFSIAGSGLLGTCMLHKAMLERIPPSNVMTRGDTLLLITYAAVLSNLCVSTVLLHAIMSNVDPGENIVHRYYTFLLPAVLVPCYLSLVLDIWAWLVLGLAVVLGSLARWCYDLRRSKAAAKAELQPTPSGFDASPATTDSEEAEERRHIYEQINKQQQQHESSESELDQPESESKTAPRSHQETGPAKGHAEMQHVGWDSTGSFNSAGGPRKRFPNSSSNR